MATLTKELIDTLHNASNGVYKEEGANGRKSVVRPYASLSSDPDTFDNLVNIANAVSDDNTKEPIAEGNLTHLVKSAEGASTGIASVLSATALSFPAALRARAEDNRSHVWQVIGAASTGKSYNSIQQATTLNTMLQYTHAAMANKTPPEDMEKVISQASSQHFNAMYKNAGLEVDHAKWAKDFVSNADKLFHSKTPPLAGSGKEMQRAQYKDNVGVYTGQDVVPGVGEGPPTLTMIHPHTGAVVQDDIHSLSADGASGAYQKSMNLMGDEGIPSAQFVLNSNFDEKMLSSFTDTYKNEGTKDRSGLMMHVGSFDNDIKVDSQKAFHDVMKQRANLELVKTAFEAGAQEGDPKDLLLRKQDARATLARHTQVARNVNTAKDASSDLIKTVRGLAEKAGIPEFHEALKDLQGANYDGFTSLLRQKDGKGDPTNNVEHIGSFLGSLAESWGGGDKEHQQNTASLTAESISNFLDKAGYDTSLASTFKESTGKLTDSIKKNGLKDFIAQNTRETLAKDLEAGAKKQSTMDKLTGSLQAKFKEAVEGMKGISHTGLVDRLNIPNQVEAAMKQGSVSSGWGLAQAWNNSHICSATSAPEKDSEITLTRGQNNERTVIDMGSLLDKRPLKQYHEVIDAVQSYVKDPGTAREFSRDLTVTAFGFSPGAKELLTKENLFVQRPERKLEDLPALLANPDYHISNAIEPTKEDLEKVVNFTQALSKIPTQAATSVQGVNKKITDMFNDLLNKDGKPGVLDEATDSNLGQMEKILSVTNSHKKELVDMIAEHPEAGEIEPHFATMFQLSNSEFSTTEDPEKAKEAMDEYKKTEICPKKGDIPGKISSAKGQLLKNSSSPYAKGLNNSRLMRGLGIA